MLTAGPSTNFLEENGGAIAVLFTINEATKQLGGISPWTLRKHIAKGAIKVTRIGRRVFVGAGELERIQREGLPSLRVERERCLPNSVVSLNDAGAGPCR